MSLYEAPAKDPAYTVEVGFTVDDHTFWFFVYEGTHEVSGEMGLPSLYHLVKATWGYVDWPAARELARRLRDDAAWVADAKDDLASRYLADALSV